MPFRKRTARKSAKGKPTLLRRVVRALLWTILAFYLFCALSLVGLRWVNPPFTTVQLQRKIEAAFSGKEYEARQSFVPLRQLPLDLQRAVIAAEDGSFYEHSGLDWKELDKVWEEAADGGRLRGGSTITQQLVKNLFLTTHSWPVRKAFDFTLAPLAEGILPKERILEIYLNVIEWGPGVYGAEQAARYHYKMPVAQLSREQAARLAACIPAPRTRRPGRMNEYSGVILDRMDRRGW
jgi:monofunctional biosynthetic peptidoglycan transglycosylase